MWCGQHVDLQEATSGDAEVPNEGLKVLEVSGVVATFDVLGNRRHGEAGGSHPRNKESPAQGGGDGSGAVVFGNAFVR